MVDIFPSNTQPLNLQDKFYVSIPFEMGEPPIVYRDTLIIPKAQFEQMSDAEIGAMKTSRYESWLRHVAQASQVGSVDG